jgi:hypothetical protein
MILVPRETGGDISFSTVIIYDMYYIGKKTISLFCATSHTGGWLQLLDKKLRIFYDNHWQPSFNWKPNYSMHADAGIERPIWQ